MSTEPTHLARSSLEEGLDPALVRRLTTPLVQPGVISASIARRIIGWVDYFSGRLPLLSELSKKQGKAAAGGREELPVVYAQPATSITVAFGSGSAGGEADDEPEALIVVKSVEKVVEREARDSRSLPEQSASAAPRADAASQADAAAPMRTATQMSAATQVNTAPITREALLPRVAPHEKDEPQGLDAPLPHSARTGVPAVEVSPLPAEASSSIVDVIPASHSARTALAPTTAPLTGAAPTAAQEPRAAAPRAPEPRRGAAPPEHDARATSPTVIRPERMPLAAPTSVNAEQSDDYNYNHNYKNLVERLEQIVIARPERPTNPRGGPAPQRFHRTGAAPSLRPDSGTLPRPTGAPMTYSASSPSRDSARGTTRAFTADLPAVHESQGPQLAPGAAEAPQLARARPISLHEKSAPAAASGAPLPVVAMPEVRRGDSAAARSHLPAVAPELAGAQTRAPIGGLPHLSRAEAGPIAQGFAAPPERIPGTYSPGAPASPAQFNRAGALGFVPGAVPGAPPSMRAGAPLGADIAARPPSAEPVIDIDSLANKVQRKLLRSAMAERERKGGLR
jgi:hypothetical protein